MGGPEYARFVGIRSLEPVGVYLPGDKNYPVGRRQWRSSPPNHLFHESGAPRRTSIVHQPGSNHLISYTTLLDHLCFQAVHDCAVVASNLPKVCSSISTVRSCISAAWWLTPPLVSILTAHILRGERRSTRSGCRTTPRGSSGSAWLR